MKNLLINSGFDAIHTDDLPDQERTTDEQIRIVSVEQNRIVITKDSDFVDSYYVKGIPQKILLISTGNIKNKFLYELFHRNLDEMIHLLKICDFVELNNSELLGYE